MENFNAEQTIEVPIVSDTWVLRTIIVDANTIVITSASTGFQTNDEWAIYAVIEEELAIFSCNLVVQILTFHYIVNDRLPLA